MAHIRIVQLLCPSRHAIVAVAYVSEDGAEDPKMSSVLLERFEQSGMARRCAICGSVHLAAEDRPTIFSSMDEAIPVLKAQEALQQLARAYLKAFRN